MGSRGLIYEHLSLAGASRLTKRAEARFSVTVIHCWTAEAIYTISSTPREFHYAKGIVKWNQCKMAQLFFIRHTAPDWGFFSGDDAYTLTTNGNIEVLAVEAVAKVKMLRFILSPPREMMRTVTQQSRY